MPSGKALNILSLFDGMSCGRISIDRLGIGYSNYFASEIDEYAIKVGQENYPDNIQLGDVNNWKNWNLPEIDLLLAGSPCQGFSVAGQGFGFDDPRSKLFFVFVDILRKIKPKFFLLENVSMKKEWQDIISEILGVVPLNINSSLVSAQNRKRLYWTNISVKSLPEDRGVVIKDILDETVEESFFLRNKPKNVIENTRQDGILVVDNIYPSKGQNGNIYSVYGKSKTLSAGVGIKGRGIGSSNSPKIFDGSRYRRLTPTECEKLQTVPPGYTKGVSDTQRYKMLGNGWTIDVICHILKNLDDSHALW